MINLSNYKKIILIYYANSKVKIPINGPSAVVMNIEKYWKKSGIDFEAIPITRGKKFDIFKLVFKLLSSRNRIINVHQSGNKLPLLVFIISKLNRGNKYYFTTHGSNFLEETNSNVATRKKHYLEKFLISNFENVISVSKMYMRDILYHLEIKGNINYINNGYSPSETSNNIVKKNNMEIKLMLAGGIKNNKGIFESLKLVNFLKKEIKDKKVFLTIIGGYEENDYQIFSKYIEKHNLEKNILYRGIVNDKEKVYDFYKEADYVLSLSHYDTFNVSVIEALSVGTPVIISDTTGSSEFVNNKKNGLIVNLKDNYKNRILEYIKEGNDLNQDQYCMNSIKDISWEETAQNYLLLLQM